MRIRSLCDYAGGGIPRPPALPCCPPTRPKTRHGCPEPRSGLAIDQAIARPDEGCSINSNDKQQTLCPASHGATIQFWELPSQGWAG